MSKMKELMVLTGVYKQINEHSNRVLAEIHEPATQLAIKCEVNSLLDDMCREMDLIYTKEEVEQLVEFYKSDLGKMMLSKIPHIMEATSRLMAEYNNKIQEIVLYGPQQSESYNNHTLN